MSRVSNMLLEADEDFQDANRQSCSVLLMGNFLENNVKILKLFVRVGRWYMSKCVKKKNQ
jgi:hypothetical protein